MDLKLKERVIIVNGASQGIGLGIARQLAEEGARVVMTARREPALQAAVESVRQDFGTKDFAATILALQGDIRRAADCERIVASAAEHFGAIHGLVNNDGAPPLGQSLQFDDAGWAKAIEQNFMSVLRMSRGVAPHMRSAGGGAIVNITALSVLQPLPGFGLSVATWAGVVGLAKTLSLELAADKITVNTIFPGLIETPRYHLVAQQSGGAMESAAAEIPLRRLGQVEDIAALVALLLSPRGSYITGTSIQVDGGLRRNLL